MIATSPTPHGAWAAHGVAALFIPRPIGASRVAGPAASGASTTGASASAALDGGRSRATPPSLRFLGPKVYIAAIVVLIAILRHGATAPRMRELTEVIGVDRRTVERWRTWWRDSFTATPFWQVARAAFMPPVDQDRLPAALIERFAGDNADRLVALLRFMGPLTGGRMQAR